MEHSEAPQVMPQIWLDIARYKSPRTFLRPGLHWFGIPERVRADRLQRLVESKPARALLARLAHGSEADLAQLQTLAAINAQQAQDVFRRAFVINISTPAAFIVAFGQLAPEVFGGVLDTLRTEGALGYVVLALSALVLISIGYAFLRANDARDLRDLIAIRAAAR